MFGNQANALCLTVFMIEKQIHVKNVGAVSLRKSKTFKRLSIRISPHKGIWVNLPLGISNQEGIRFIQANENWIVETKKKQEAKQKQKILFAENTEFKTRFRRLKIETRDTHQLSSNLEKGILRITYPKHLAPHNEQVQNFIKAQIVEILRDEAKTYLPQRLEFFAKKYEFHYTGVKIKNAKTRWGSCSHNNNINLNLQLMRLPEDLSDMVILHELCHTKIKNHSKLFWNLLEKHCPKLPQKRKQLKQYSLHDF